MVDAAFLALSVITIGSAIAALELRSMIYGSMALMGTLGGIAGFFLLLDSPFIAMFQIAVYVGSIAVLILFTVMLVKRELIFKKIEDPRRKFAGIGLMLILMMGLGSIIIDSVIVSIALLGIGIYGLSVKRNAIRMLFAVEIIINAANLNLVAFARFIPHSGGQTLVLFSIATAAAEVAVGLSLIIVAYRMYQNIDIADFRSLKG